MLMLRMPSGTLDEIPRLPPEDAVLVVVRLLAFAVAGWLTASTLLYGLASATRLPALVRGVQWLTLPGIRRLVDGLGTTTVIATATLSIPGTASAMPSTSLGAGPAAPAAPPSSMPPPCRRRDLRAITGRFRNSHIASVPPATRRRGARPDGPVPARAAGDSRRLPSAGRQL